MSATHGPHLRLRRDGRYSPAMPAASTLALFALAALALIAIPWRTGAA
jgi:hypothetical protein